MANRIQIQTALQKPYDRILFGKEVLSPVFGSCFNLSSSAVPASVQPNKSEQAVIQSVSIYGTINLEDGTEITCYEIILQPSIRIEHSKVAIQRYVRKLLTAGQIALVNFIAPQNKKVWRLTLVAKDSELTEQGIKEKTTHAKRYTYLLGPSETCKTAAERFESLSTEKQITFQALVNAFSVEKLSKAFFDEYTLHYQKFCDYLQESNFRKSVFKISIPTNATKEEKDKACKPIRDFVKKLLGRIVFLYFVQKKGWLGASDTNYKDGLTDFIKQLFKQSGGNDAFYSTWLTVLFFETLNKERSNDDFKMPDGKKVKVPFLNGGLFDKEDHDEHILTFKSKLFHHPDFEDTLLTEKNRDNARGFLDFLDAFNFTVHEDSPDDHTVAVDPEMLGHIFENLLEDNKDKGAFYTPKEIVHYMCQESLTEYLSTHLSKEYTVYKEIGNAQVELFGNETKTGQLKMVEQLGDKALNRDDVAYIVKHKDISHLTKAQLKKIDALLDTVKICDPAIGSGAFPMGLLQEIHAIKEVIAYELQQPWKPADVKENIIQNSVYGVDIEKGAVDIARLRFWLSLVVDEEKPRALPNLDYKIVVGDSLVSKFEGEIIEIDWERKSSVGKADTFVQNIQRLLKEIAEKQKKFFKPDNKDKKKLQSEIRNLKLELLINQLSFNKEKLLASNVEKGGFAPTVKDLRHNEELSQKKKNYEAHINKLQTLKQETDEAFVHFDWKLDFPEVLNPYLVNENEGFDIVIANPPYIGQKGNKSLFEPLSSDPNFEKKMDYWYFFLHKSHALTKDSGINTFITPNYWITTQGGKKLRKRIIENYSIIEYINFNENAIFEAGVHTNIFMLKKNELPNERIKCTIYQNKYSENIFSYRNEELNFSANQNEIYNNWTGFIHFLPANVSRIINQLYIDCEKLSDNESEGENKTNSVAGKKITNGICNINQGIITGKDRFKDKTRGINEGVYILTPEELNGLNLSKQESEFIKPFVKNSDINKYTVSSEADYYIIYVDDIQNEEDFNKLAKIKNHLSNYRELLAKRYINGVLQSAYKKGKWWALIHSVPIQIIKNEKIICPQRSRYNLFGFQQEETYASADVYYISLNRLDFNLKYILTILNSKLVYFWLYWMGKRKGEMLELYFEPLQFIPIKKISKNEQSSFSVIADYILFVKEHTEFENINDQLMPTYFEQIIDGMVYELYFPDLIKKHKREIIQHLGELPEFTDKMSDEQKMKICKTVFNRLNDREHPVRVNLFYMSSIPEIAIIEGKNENN